MYKNRNVDYFRDRCCPKYASHQKNIEIKVVAIEFRTKSLQGHMSISPLPEWSQGAKRFGYLVSVIAFPCSSFSAYVRRNCQATIFFVYLVKLHIQPFYRIHIYGITGVMVKVIVKTSDAIGVGMLKIDNFCN